MGFELAAALDRFATPPLHAEPSGVAPRVELEPCVPSLEANLLEPITVDGEKASCPPSYEEAEDPGASGCPRKENLLGGVCPAAAAEEEEEEAGEGGANPAALPPRRSCSEGDEEVGAEEGGLAPDPEEGRLVLCGGSTGRPFPESHEADKKP